MKSYLLFSHEMVTLNVVCIFLIHVLDYSGTDVRKWVEAADPPSDTTTNMLLQVLQVGMCTGNITLTKGEWCAQSIENRYNQNDLPQGPMLHVFFTFCELIQFKFLMTFNILCDVIFLIFPTIY